MLQLPRLVVEIIKFYLHQALLIEVGALLSIDLLNHTQLKMHIGHMDIGLNFFLEINQINKLTKLIWNVYFIHWKDGGYLKIIKRNDNIIFQTYYPSSDQPWPDNQPKVICQITPR